MSKQRGANRCVYCGRMLSGTKRIVVSDAKRKLYVHKECRELAQQPKVRKEGSNDATRKLPGL